MNAQARLRVLLVTDDGPSVFFEDVMEDLKRYGIETRLLRVFGSAEEWESHATRMMRRFAPSIIHCFGVESAGPFRHSPNVIISPDRFGNAPPRNSYSLPVLLARVRRYDIAVGKPRDRAIRIGFVAYTHEHRAFLEAFLSAISILMNEWDDALPLRVRVYGEHEPRGIAGVEWRGAIGFDSEMELEAADILVSADGSEDFDVDVLDIMAAGCLLVVPEDRAAHPAIDIGGNAVAVSRDPREMAVTLSELIQSWPLYKEHVEVAIQTALREREAFVGACRELYADIARNGMGRIRACVSDEALSLIRRTMWSGGNPKPGISDKLIDFVRREVSRDPVPTDLWQPDPRETVLLDESFPARIVPRRRDVLRRLEGIDIDARARKRRAERLICLCGLEYVFDAAMALRAMENAPYDTLILGLYTGPAFGTQTMKFTGLDDIARALTRFRLVDSTVIGDVELGIWKRN